MTMPAAMMAMTRTRYASCTLHRYIKLLTSPWSVVRHQYWCKARPRLRAVVVAVMLCGYKMRDLYLSAASTEKHEHQHGGGGGGGGKGNGSIGAGVGSNTAAGSTATSASADAAPAGASGGSGSDGGGGGDGGGDMIVRGHPLAFPLPIELWVGVVLKFISWGDWPNEL